MSDRTVASDAAHDESRADSDDALDWSYYDVDGELAGIGGALDDGLIFIESTGGWILREDADEEFGAEVAARMAAQQQVQFTAYLQQRREAYIRDQHE